MIVGRKRIAVAGKEVLEIEEAVTVVFRKTKRALSFQFHFERTRGEVSETEDGEDLDFVPCEHYDEIL